MDSSDQPNQDKNLEEALSMVSKSDQDDDHHQSAGESGSSSARSYECTFCKRGFSNAQALGGHMNIHRKDKAKLKQLVPPFSINHETPQQQQSLEIPKTLPSYSSLNPWFDLDREAVTIRDNIDHDHQVQGKSDERASTLSARGRHSSSDSDQLDLELRLGREPQDLSTSSNKATRKFF